jgi:two-component system response regulator MprA
MYAPDSVSFPNARSTNGRRTVLIVDDDPGVTQTFARMLTLGGYDVLTALDATSGLREIEQVHPDAVLLDLRMPRVDGLAFLRLLRAQEAQRRTPVGVITGDYALPETVHRELCALDATVHYKPLWIDDLLDITRRLLEHAH